MKMYLIDPVNNSVTMIEDETDFNTLYKIIGAGCGHVQQIRHAFVGYDDIIYVDEDARMRQDVPPLFATPHCALVGKAVVMGYHNGREVKPTIPLKELKAQVFFPGRIKAATNDEETTHE